MSDPVSILAALTRIHEHFQPHRLASVNNHDVKIAKIEGEFIWHAHPDSDELFVVISGELTIQLRDRDVPVNPRGRRAHGALERTGQLRELGS